MLVPILLFIVGLVLLIKGGDWFVDARHSSSVRLECACGACRTAFSFSSRTLENVCRKHAIWTSASLRVILICAVMVLLLPVIPSVLPSYKGTINEIAP